MFRRLGALLPKDTLLDFKAELFFVFLQLSRQLGVSPPDRLDLEQPVDGLERDTAGFGDQEEGEEEREERECGEEEVDTVVHLRKHLLGEPRDEEVEQPVASCCRGLREGSEVGIEEFLNICQFILPSISIVRYIPSCKPKAFRSMSGCRQPAKWLAE